MRKWAMPKRPRDPNQLAKAILDIAIGDVEDHVSEKKRSPDKRREGGLKGGPARAKELSTEKRSEIAKRAAIRRWRGV